MGMNPKLRSVVDDACQKYSSPEAKLADFLELKKQELLLRQVAAQKAKRSVENAVATLKVAEANVLKAKAEFRLVKAEKKLQRVTMGTVEASRDVERISERLKSVRETTSGLKLAAR